MGTSHIQVENQHHLSFPELNFVPDASKKSKRSLLFVK